MGIEIYIDRLDLDLRLLICMQSEETNITAVCFRNSDFVDMFPNLKLMRSKEFKQGTIGLF